MTFVLNPNTADRYIIRSVTGDLDVLGIPDVPGAPINVKVFGAVGDGATDDTSAFQEALTAAADAALYVPAGRYKLTAQLALSGAGITITGAGIGGSELRWTAGASTRGILLSPDDASQFIAVRDLRLTTEGTAGDALTIDCSQQIVDTGGGSMNTMDRVQPRFSIESCMFSGSGLIDSANPFTTAWGAAIRVESAVSGVVRDCTVCGLAVNSTIAVSGYNGISFYGTPFIGNNQNGHPVQFVVDNCTVWFCDMGIQFLNCEGCYVVNSNIVACNYGVYALSETAAHPQLCVANSHANCSIRSILIYGMTQINISGCLLYVIQNATNGICLEASGGGSTGSITGNTCVALSANANGIVIANYSYVSVSNNAFMQVGSNMISAIWLTTGSSKCLGSQNIYNSAFTHTVFNQGIDNVVT